MEAPALSFGIPFYSGRKYLERTLQSILSQRDGHWHAYVCDDGSEPGIEEMVRRIGAGRIRYSKNPTNIGMANNFNQCIELAETDLVTILHADDELMPNYVETMRAASLRYPTAAALYCRTEVIDAESRRTLSVLDAVKDHVFNPSVTKEVVLQGERGLYALLAGNFINAPTLCFRKSVLGSRRFSELKFVLDWELTTRLLLDGDVIVGLPQRCYRYRRHDEAATSRYTRNQLRFREEAEFFDRMVDASRARGWYRCAERASRKRFVKLNLMYFALRSAIRGDFDETRRDLALLREL